MDGSDLWFHSAYDERWRKLATFRESDSDPKEEFIPHQAGLSGLGGSSYINLVVCRDRDANTAWTAASDGVLEEKMFYCQNWRGDVSAIVRSTGILYEWAKYSSYGVPFGLPGGDTDSDGDCDSTDVSQIQTWINASSYDVRGDIDLDGDVDADDKSVVTSFFQGKTAGWEVLSTIRNRRGYAGYSFDRKRLWHARRRVLDSRVGRWLQRDPLGYVDGPILIEYVRANPIGGTDPLGAFSVSNEGQGGFNWSPGGTGGWWESAQLIALIGYLDFLTFLQSGNLAGSFVDYLFPGQTGPGMNNAVFHCMMSCILCYGIGPDQAKEAMANHERLNLAESSGPRAAENSAMDTWNNNIGFSVCESGGKCSTGCLGSAAAGALWY